MTYVLEIDQDGNLEIPSEILPEVTPHSRYHLEVLGDTLILRPQQSIPFWASATPTQRAARFRAWGQQTTRPRAPILSDEALSRETIYD